MSDNIRWLIALTAASVTIVTVVTALPGGRGGAAGDPTDGDGTGSAHRLGRPTRRQVATVIAGLLVFWAAAQLPPFQPWQPARLADLRGAIDRAQSPQVLVACLVYLAIVVASSRGLIGMPIYRQFQARAAELRQSAEYGCFRQSRTRIVDSIDRVEQTAARRVGRFVVSVPLPDALGANRTLNAIEKQMIAVLENGDLRLAASQIAALLPATQEGADAAESIARAAAAMDRGRTPSAVAEARLRGACAAALILLHRLRDVPQEREVNHIRVSVWLTMVGLAATYALSVTWPGHEEVMIAGALGGLLGSLSALITNRDISLGMVVLSPVAGALNALGGSIVIGFLAQEQIQLLGAAFREVWSTTAPATVTALAVAVLLGFSGGLFARIAVAGTAPLLGGETKTETPPAAALAPARNPADAAETDEAETDDSDQAVDQDSSDRVAAEPDPANRDSTDRDLASRAGRDVADPGSGTRRPTPRTNGRAPDARSTSDRTPVRPGVKGLRTASRREPGP